jgi:hypothetical protein
VTVDEIDAYLSGRFLTASEAVWRFLGLPLHKEFPNIFRLDVHLPGYQNVVFDPTEDMRDIFEAAERSSSTLLEWFALNQRDFNARQYLYTDIPEHYVWKDGTWFQRSYTKKKTVARIYSVSLHNQELFALRTLLKCQRGCTSFADILTVDGFIHSTFREACAAYGFVQNDSEFIAAFTEYLDTTVASTRSVRHQFALMLCCIQVFCAEALFEHFATDLIGTETRYEALFTIELKMKSMNRSLTDTDFQFPDVPNIDFELCRQSDSQTYAFQLPQLTMEQEQAMTSILAMIQNKNYHRNNLLAVIASAGTGKTAFIKYAASQLHLLGISTMCVAASALAATLLPNGQTAHAALKIPILCDDQSFCTWDIETRHRLSSTEVIFWDEISMVDYHIAETVDRSLRYLMRNDQMFGGKIVIFCGDFRQLPPVIKSGKGEYSSLLTRDWFLAAQKATFTHNFRLNNDVSYEQLLPKIGDGLLDAIQIPEACIVDSLDAAISKVYGDNVTDESNAGCIMLAYTLQQCAIVNEAVFNKILGEPTFSTAVDDCSECKTPDEYPCEYIASLFISGIPPGILALKPKARYMISRNFDPPTICNGIMAELIGATRYNCTMKLLNGPGQGKTVVLPRISFHVPSEVSGLPFNFKRRQFPMSLAYCLSVHKSQGQSLRRVGFIADTDTFSHGQVFVAMSRVGSWSQFTFFSPRGEQYIKNKVSKYLINSLNSMHSIDHFATPTSPQHSHNQ